MKTLVMIAVAVLVPMSVLSLPGDKGLQFHMQQSDVAVAGIITSEITLDMRGTGAPTYTFTFQVSKVLHGSLAGGKTPWVELSRLESAQDDALPFIKKDAKCILFLNFHDSHRGWGTVWRVADPWFGAQPYNSAMAKRIKELTKEKKP